jgi:hypothetical protein
MAQMAVRDHIRHTINSQIRRSVIVRGPGRCHPRSYTIVMAHRSVIAVESASKPEGGSIAHTRASAKVSGCDTHLKFANVLTVGMHRPQFATNGAGIGTSAFGW